MARALVLALVLSVLSVPAFALTPAEKLDLRAQSMAQSWSEEAKLYVQYSLQFVDDQTRTLTATAHRYVVRAEMRGLLWFGYVRHVNMFDGDAGTILDGKPVEYWVAQAWPHLDAQITNLKSAQQTATQLLAITGKPPAYYDNWRRFRDLHLGNALTQLAKIDKSHTYLEWCESKVKIPQPDGTEKELCTVIGPHGEFVAHSVGWTAMKMMNEVQEMISDMLVAKDPIAPPGGGVVDPNWPPMAPFERMILRTVNIQRHFRHAWVNGLLLPLNVTECAKNPFHLVAEGMRFAMSHTSESGGQVGTPYHYDQLKQDVHRTMSQVTLTRPNLRRLYDSFDMRTNTSWRFQNGWLDRIFKFPSEDILQAIREQGGVPGSKPFDPPLCPP